MNRDLGINTPAFYTGDEPQDFAEKRRFPRRQLAVRCWIGDGRHTIYARLHDLSAGGLSLRAPVPFSPSTELDLALVVAGSLDDPHGEMSIRARGRVVWAMRPEAQRGACGLAAQRVLPKPSGPRMGAEFVEFLEGKDLLLRLIEQR